MNNYIIKTENLSKNYNIRITEGSSFFKRLISKKTYKTVEALRDISLNINKGEFVGLIGNNGAGKSTLVKLLTGILYPTEGMVRVLGRDPFKDRVKNNKDIGVVFGQRSQLKWDLSPIDSYLLLKEIYQIDDEVFKKNIDTFINLFEMQDIINCPVRTLSLGQRMRCEIASAFLHNPKIVFLDEPTIGLDVFSKDAISEFLNKMKQLHDTTVILTTHDLEEMHDICDRTIVISEGQILLEDKIDNLMQIHNSKKRLIFTTKNKEINFPYKGIYSNCLIESHSLVFNDVNKEEIQDLIEKVMKFNDVIDMNIEKVNFTDIIKKLLSNERGIHA